ncbi:DUF4145 domain-containing protein [Flavobacterium sp.]|uniref:DUF4145 domain-containing protein n=1 Tax=Flavobacterium sp. TaxID=239 RepID=UPI002605F61B|nr:DUF4145 domain-containing protein [Flavobacterium sp.]
MENKVLQNYCSVCKNYTKHELLFERIIEGEYEEYKTFKQVVECRGCEYLSFRIEEHDYWDIDPEAFYFDGETEEEVLIEGHDAYKITIDTFPANLSGHSQLKNLYTIPSQIKSVYDQTILAFKGKSFLLAGVGFRAIIEAICIQENIKGSNLEIKINNLAKNRLITDRESARLHTIRFLGNDSVHEMEIPQERKLFLVLDIIENLLKNLYILDGEAKNILDTIITDYSEFEDFLWRCSEKSIQTEEKTIKEILGKHVRRIKIDLINVEKIVVNRINTGNIEFLKLGGIKNNPDNSKSQLFTFTGKEYDELPF